MIYKVFVLGELINDCIVVFYIEILYNYFILLEYIYYSMF